MKRLVPCLIAPAALFAACAAPPATEGMKTASGDSLQGAKGAEFVRCWTKSDGTKDDFFRTYTLSCRVSSKGLEALPKSYVNVDAQTTGGKVVSATPGKTPDQDVVIGRVYESDFPLNVSVYGSWGLGDYGSTYFRTVVPMTTKETVDEPSVVKLPFETWSVSFLSRLPFAAVSSAQYEVNAAPFITEQDVSSKKTTFTTSFTTEALSAASRVDLQVIAPTSGSASVTVQGPASQVTATITGSAVYVIDSNGMHVATADALAGTDAVDGGSPGTGSDGLDSGSPSDPVDAGTTQPTDCGNPGQSPCHDASNQLSCNPGTRFDSNNGVCVACGAAGQTFCYSDPKNADTSSGARCNAGTRFDSYNGVCVACGDAGQTFCYNDAKNADTSSGARCNAGTRFDSYNGVCAACGTAGQTCCVDDPKNVSGSPVCTAPASCNSYSNTCQ